MLRSPLRVVYQGVAVPWIAAMAALRCNPYSDTGSFSCHCTRMGSRSAGNSVVPSPTAPGYRNRKYRGGSGDGSPAVFRLEPRLLTHAAVLPHGLVEAGKSV